MADPSDRLLAFLREQVGDALRGVVRYSSDEHDVRYTRPDVRERHSAGYFTYVVERFRDQQHSVTDQQAFGLGPLAATSHVFRDAIVLHLPTGAESGVVVSLDPGAGEELTMFLQACRARLDG